MKKSKLEKITASFAVTFLFILVFGMIMLIADQIFNWNLFDRRTEQVLGFVMVALGLTIGASVVVNIMINVGVMADSIKKIANKQ